MPISDEFSGLPMGEPIGGPLDAMVEAQAKSAKATMEFIKGTNLEPNTARFTYTKGGEPQEVDVPLLAIAPIPYLGIDDTDITFDMEVKQSKDEESPEDTAAGHFDISTGFASPGQAEVQPPKGLTRVLDILENSILPTDRQPPED